MNFVALSSSLSRRPSKEQSDVGVCLPRVNSSKLVSQTWKNFDAAYDKLYDQLRKTTKAIAQFIQEFELRKKEPEQKQEVVAHAAENSKEDNARVIAPARIKVKGVESKSKGLACVTTKDVASSVSEAESKKNQVHVVKAKESEELYSLKELLAKFEHQHSKVTANENIDEEQNKLAKSSFFRRKLSKILHASFGSSRSSKVRCLNNAKDGHALTLTDLYELEKQLCHNVKKLQHEENSGRLEKVRMVRRNATWVIKEIRNLRESDIRKHLCQLQQSLTLFWQNNSDAYKQQVDLMTEIVNIYDVPEKLCVKSGQWRATEKLKSQLEDWRACFDDYFCSQKAHIDALNNWARLPFPTCCEDDENEDDKSKNNDNQSNETLLKLLEKWSTCLDNLFTNEEGTKYIGDFVDKVGQLLESQDNEYEQNIKFGQLKVQWKNHGKSDKLAPRVKEEEEQHEALREAIEKNAKHLIHRELAPFLQIWGKFSLVAYDSYNALVAEDQNALVAT